MRKWMRDRMKRRTKSGKPEEGTGKDQEQKTGPAPLQPTFLDRESEYHADDSQGEQPEPKKRSSTPSEERQPEYEAQPEADPQDHEAEADPVEAPAGGEAQPRGERGKSSRRRGRGGRGRNRNRGDKAATPPPVVFQPGFATGEAAEVDVPPEGAAEPVQ